MRTSTLFASGVLAAALAAPLRDARACAVLTPDETTPVTGHQMILSVSPERTTLWDRFRYSGTPESFAWILPTKGEVEIGISSDALFEALGQVTAPQIFAPTACPNSCKGNDGAGGGFGGGGVVDVIAHEVVGPYETVQLSADDPDALKEWLADNGYPIPEQVAPLLDAYVAEGFDFLAMKLLPGKGLDATRPVRVTMQGAAPSVPIRLLAAGTGEITQVTLWVLSEGRYEPTNAPVATIAESDLTWDFATGSSDYAAVKTAKLAASDGLAWLLEQARPYETWEIGEPLELLVEGDPEGSGYGGEGVEPGDALAADLDALYGDLGDSPWIMRFSADLSREALEHDLVFGAASKQEPYEGTYYVTKTANQPECPPDPCGEGGGGQGGGASGSGAGAGATTGSGNGTGSGSGPDGSNAGSGSGGDDDDGGCGIHRGRSPSGAMAVAAALGVALAAATRRRRTARSPR